MASGEELKYGAGRTICEEGEREQAIFILKQGRVAIYKGERLVGELSKPGTVFGEMALMLGEPRTATLKALVPSTLTEVRVSLRELVTHFPKFTERLLTTLALRLKDTTAAFTESVLPSEAAEVHAELEEAVQAKKARPSAHEELSLT